MITFDNMLPQTTLSVIPGSHGLNPASGAEQPSDHRREQHYPPPKKQLPQEETVSENDSPREYAPITPSSGGIIRRHIPLREEPTYIDGGQPPAALRRRAKEYERMMLYH